MTKSEVVNAIRVVMSDVINECYRRTHTVPEKDRVRIFEISEKAEHLMEELTSEAFEVKQIEGYSNDHPKIIEIKRRLDKKSMDYLNQLYSLAHH